MTREEKEQTGKYVLQMARLLEDGCYQQEMLLKAVHIIDEALEQEPTTKNNLGVDCIDRKATLDAIIKRLGIKNEAYLLEAERVIYQQILAIPPVTPIRPKGHWIYHREEDYKCCEHWECSNCHKSTMTNPMYEKNDYDHMYYCPKCGAKMN